MLLPYYLTSTTHVSKFEPPCTKKLLNVKFFHLDRDPFEQLTTPCELQQKLLLRGKSKVRISKDKTHKKNHISVTIFFTPTMPHCVHCMSILLFLIAGVLLQLIKDETSPWWEHKQEPMRLVPCGQCMWQQCSTNSALQVN